MNSRIHGAYGIYVTTACGRVVEESMTSTSRIQKDIEEDSLIQTDNKEKCSDVAS